MLRQVGGGRHRCRFCGYTPMCLSQCSSIDLQVALHAAQPALHHFVGEHATCHYRYVLGLAHSHGLLGEAAPDAPAGAELAAAAEAALQPFLHERSAAFYHELRHACI